MNGRNLHFAARKNNRVANGLPTPSEAYDKGNNNPTRGNNFDGLRLIGALLVLWSHMFALSGRWEPRFFQDHSFGNLGVLIFFSISGYLISASWHADPDVQRFLIKRILRMVPALVISTTITYTLVSAIGLLGFPDNPLHSLNGSLWTLPLEFACYLLFMIAAMLIPTPALALFIVALSAHCFLAPSYLSYFGLFFAAGSLLQKYPAMRSLKTIMVFAIAALLAQRDSIVALALIVPPIAIHIGTRSWPILRSLGRFGDLSYGVYIYAWPVQQIIISWLGLNTPYLILFSLSTIISLTLAWLSWHYIEAPALRLKPTRHDISTN